MAGRLGRADSGRRARVGGRLGEGRRCKPGSFAGKLDVDIESSGDSGPVDDRTIEDHEKVVGEFVEGCALVFYRGGG